MKPNLVNEIKELLCNICSVIVYPLDDRHFEIQHDPGHATRIMLTLKGNGYTRLNHENNTTVVRKNF